MENAANVGPGEAQAPNTPATCQLNIDCEAKQDPKKTDPKWEPCMIEQMCAMVKSFNESKTAKKRISPSPSERATKQNAPDMTAAQRKAHNALNKQYKDGLATFSDNFDKLVAEKGADSPEVASQFTSKCQHDEWKKTAKTPMPRGASTPGGMSPDHVHDAGLGGPISGPALQAGLKWADSRVNQTVGAAMRAHKPDEEPGGVVANPNCNCPP